MDKSINKSLTDLAIEYEEIIEDLNDEEIKYNELKKEFFDKSEKIIEETNFKALYNKNNKEVRDAHVNKILKDECEELEYLKYHIRYLQRKIDLIKNIINIKIFIGEQ